MRWSFRWSTIAAGLGAMLIAAGCENLGETTAPRLEPSATVVTSRSGQRFVVAYERNPSVAEASTVIGPEGGVLAMGAHALWVSPGAVASPTRFTMKRSGEKLLRVELTAGDDNVVGAAGFRAPVYLGLSMAQVDNVPSGWARRTAKIVYHRDDGMVDVLESYVWGHLAIARLDHFSMYSLAWP